MHDIDTEQPLRPELGRLNLTAQQTAVVEAGSGPVLVLAGAGCAKTTVLVAKVMAMVGSDIDPKSILVLAFGRDARREFVARLERVLAPPEMPVVRTFHSFCARVLRRSVVEPECQEVIHRRPGFGHANTLELLTDARQDLGLVQHPDLQDLDRVETILSLVANRRQSIDAVLKQDYWRIADSTADVLLLADRYEQLKRQQNIVDYPDVLDLTVRLLEHRPEVLQSLQDQYRHILVDEFQDLSRVQAELVFLLGRRYQDVIAVGDPDQHIFTFTGADPENFAAFEREFPDAVQYKLDRNFRSSNQILAVVNALHAQAPEHHRPVNLAKNLVSQEPDGPKPILVHAPDRDAMNRYVRDQILELRRRDPALRFHDIAVLTRTGPELGEIRQTFGPSIPSHNLKPAETTEPRHVRHALSVIRLAASPFDQSQLRLALSLCRGVGRKTIEDITAQLDPTRRLAEQLLAARAKLRSTQARQDIEVLARLLEQVTQPDHSVRWAIERALVFYDERCRHRGQYRDDFNSLREAAVQHRTLFEFLDELADRHERPSTPLDHVVLSTAHSAKGREWPVVFVINLNEKAFPHSKSSQPPLLFEELRLLAVAASRAKRRLILARPRAAIGRDLVPTRWLEPLVRSGLVVPFQPDEAIRELQRSQTASDAGQIHCAVRRPSAADLGRTGV